MSKDNKCFGQRALMPFLAMILFALLFLTFSFILKPDTADIGNQIILEIFQKWSPFAGVAFGFLSMILMYILRLFGLRKIKFGGPILLILGYLPWLIFGYNLVYLEPRYATIAIAIIAFLGKPMFYASSVLVGLGIILFFVRLFGKSNALKIILLPFFILPLNGCLGELIGVTCGFLPDSDHCFQSAAIQAADPSKCEKIKGESFSSGNPPKDKCYLMIAEKTGDTGNCDKIEGGMISYTPDECYASTALNMEDPDLCAKAPDESACRSEFGKRTGGDCGSDYKYNENTHSCEINTTPEKERTIAEGQEDASAMFVKGEAFYRPSGSNTWFPITTDTKLMAGDTIRTAPDAKVRYFLNGTGPQAGSQTVMGGINAVVPDPNNPQTSEPTLHDVSCKLLTSLGENRGRGEACVGSR